MLKDSCCDGGVRFGKRPALLWENSRAGEIFSHEAVRDAVTNGGSDLSNLVKPSDEALVARVLAGDRRAYSSLVLRHQDVVYRVCYRILGQRDAEDMAQNAFIRGYERLDTFEGRSSFGTWIVRIAMNLCLNERARNKRESERREPLYDDRDVIPAPDSSSPETELLRSEDAVRLQDALTELQSNHRAAVILKDLEGFSFREIGEMLDVSEATARVWAHRGRGRLKVILT